MIYQVIGLIAFALNVWGNWELTEATNRGHVIRLFSNAVWLVYSPLVGAWALTLNHAVFAGINVRGYRRWHRLGVESKTRAKCSGIGGMHVTVTCAHCSNVNYQCCVEGSPREFVRGKICGVCAMQLDG